MGEWDDNAGDCLLVVASDQQKAKIKTDMGKKAKCSSFGGPAQKVKIWRVTGPRPPENELIYPRTFAVVSFLVFKKIGGVLSVCSHKSRSCLLKSRFRSIP